MNHDATPNSEPGSPGPEFFILNQYFVPDVAATGHLLAELAEECVEQGREVRVITAFPCYGPPETWKACAAVERRTRLRIRRIRTTRFRKSFAIGRISNALTFLLPLATRMLFSSVRNRVFMYTSNPPFLAIVGGLVSMFRRHRYIVLLHDSYPHLVIQVGKLRSGALAEKIWHRMNRVFYRRAQGTIVLCEKAKELIIRDYGVEPDRVHVVHNWADPKALFPIAKAESDFARAHGYDKTFTLQYSGNLGLYYDFDTILGAARRLQDDPNYRFVLIGDGGKRAAIAEQVRREGLRNVDMHQYQPFETMNHSLNACDASFVTIAKGIEGISFPSKLYSSMAIGRPVLALSERGGELEALVRDAGVGLWSPVGDVDALVANIRRLREDQALAAAMGRRAREVMLERYTIQAAAREYLRVVDLAGA